MRAPLLLALLLVGCSGNIKPPPSTDGTGDTGPTGAEFVVAVDSVDFGLMSYGELLQTTVSVSNPGTEDLLLSSITVDAPFRVSPSNLTLFAGGFSTVTVFVQPTSYEDFASNLTFVADDPDIGTVLIPLTASTIRDEDGDGFDTLAAGGTDCDDTDAAVNPDAAESWYDGIDSNCDGGNDFDQDGDGYDAETDDHEPDEGMADCNDTNVEFNPGAEDIPYDNRDTNCDGSNDWDVDGDRYEVPAHGGSDCDDNDASANIHGVETFDGKDDDCDGVIDNDANVTLSPYAYNAAGNYDRTGYSIAIGDLNADGNPELVVGAPYVGAANPSSPGRGAVAVFDGPDLLPTDTDIDHADNYFAGDGASDLLGTYVAIIGDYDGDGVNDLAVGAAGTSSNSGTVYILGGDDARRGDTGDAMATFTGASSNSFGRGLGTDIDLDGDGMVELVAMYTSGSMNYVALEYGTSSPASKNVASMDAKWSTDGTEAAFYRNAPVGGDLDGDGYEDLVLSDGMADFTGTDSGAMWVLWGQGTQYAVASGADIETNATTLIRGDSSSDYDAWSTQLGDDWDGDGDNELWVYNAGEALYVVEGGSSRRAPFDPATEAMATYLWNADSEDAEMIRRAGDWDGDGYSEMLVFLEDAAGHYGLSEMFSGARPTGGPTTYNEPTDINGSLVGDVDVSGNAGWGMAPKGGDLDGDGDSDMAVGDTEYDSNKGQAYVLINDAVVRE